MPKKKVLVVDDEMSIVEMIKEFLERTGVYIVEIRTNAKEAFEAAKEFNPNLIILDEMMPEMSGSEVCEELAKDPLTQNIPIVFITGILSKDEASFEDGNIGGRAFLAKPIVFDELVPFVERHAK